jgi:alkanesulfonate monooxygenase SsuD/methylene tetrahydromethanopterin reductase-like flavin-dependent oxidoreductase (luciferase family)
VRFGLHVPQLGALAEPRVLVDLAAQAEAAGWDGCFVWDHVMHRGDPDAADPWVVLGAIAVQTERLVIGPMITPLPRRRPWKVARETTTLDRLADGRTVFGVGIGTDAYGEFTAFDEPATENRTRAAMLDEGLDLVTALWRGERVTYEGEHFTARDVLQTPTPRQQPRIPVWCAAVWPNPAPHPAPLRRAARWDGIVPVGSVDPDDAAAITAAVRSHRTATTGFDFALPSSAAVPDALDAYAAAGVTWWLQSIAPFDELDATRAVVDAGPPEA